MQNFTVPGGIFVNVSNLIYDDDDMPASKQWINQLDVLQHLEIINRCCS
jgi:hypothetical protein